MPGGRTLWITDMDPIVVPSKKTHIWPSCDCLLPLHRIRGSVNNRTSALLRLLSFFCRNSTVRITRLSFLKRATHVIFLLQRNEAKRLTSRLACKVMGTSMWRWRWSWETPFCLYSEEQRLDGSFLSFDRENFLWSQWMYMSLEDYGDTIFSPGTGWHGSPAKGYKAVWNQNSEPHWSTSPHEWEGCDGSFSKKYVQSDEEPIQLLQLNRDWCWPTRRTKMSYATFLLPFLNLTSINFIKLKNKFFYHLQYSNYLLHLSRG